MPQPQGRRWCKLRTKPHGDRGHPLPGCGRAVLLESGPQRSDRILRHSSGTTPFFVVATLAAAAADGVWRCHARLPHSPRAGRQEEGGAGGEGEGEKGDGERAKKTLHRFSGQVLKFPRAQGQCGFIESDEAKVALALEREFSVSGIHSEINSHHRHGTTVPVTIFFTFRLAPRGAENTSCNTHQGQPFPSGNSR